MNVISFKIKTKGKGTYVDKLFAVPVFRSTGLIFEYNIVIPPPFHVEVL